MKLPKIPTYFSSQAKVAILGYIILSISILLPVNNDNKKYNFTERFVSLLMVILPMVVSVYTINCLVKGSSNGGLPCDMLAWLNSGSILVWAVLVFVLTMLIYLNNDIEKTVLKHQVDDVKVEDVKVDDVKVEDVKVDDVKVEDVKVEDVKVDDVKVDDVKVDVSQVVPKISDETVSQVVNESVSNVSSQQVTENVSLVTPQIENKNEDSFNPVGVDTEQQYSLL